MSSTGPLYTDQTAHIREQKYLPLRYFWRSAGPLGIDSAPALVETALKALFAQAPDCLVVGSPPGQVPWRMRHCHDNSHKGPDCSLGRLRFRLELWLEKKMYGLRKEKVLPTEMAITLESDSHNVMLICLQLPSASECKLRALKSPNIN